MRILKNKKVVMENYPFSPKQDSISGSYYFGNQLEHKGRDSNYFVLTTSDAEYELQYQVVYPFIAKDKFYKSEKIFKFTNENYTYFIYSLFTTLALIIMSIGYLVWQTIKKNNDENKRRHTSFSSVDVFPQLDEVNDIDIKAEDLKIDTYRSSGAGGQHVNTTDSAVRITHIPTGIVVQCQNERSQIQNRETAMNMLKAKLIALAEEEQKEKIDDLQGNYSQIAWGSQIRSYVFQPYTMVKDHRTSTEVGDINRVMDGDLDDFIYSYLQSKVK